VSGDSSLFSGDLENVYGFTHKVWSPHVVENGIPADLDHASRNPTLYLALDDQEGAKESNSTVTPRSSKQHS
jgi:hypothetical protein